MKKLLRVTAKGHVAGAVFVKTGGTWQIESCAPILTWMRSYDLPTIRQRLEAQGASWEWLPCDDSYDAGIALWKQSVDNAVKAEKRQQAIARNRKAKVTA